MTDPNKHPVQVVDLLSPAAIRLDVEARDWEEAVRSAGALLTSDGIATEGYTQAMVDSLHANGPYIVIAPGFAFAHARPSAEVHRTGLSWVRLAHPVEFGHKRNDPVELVVAMAAADTTAHQAAMAQLAKVISSKPTMDELRQAPDADAVLAILARATAPKETPAAAARPAQSAPAAGAEGASRTRDHIMTVRQWRRHEPVPQEHRRRCPAEVGLGAVHHRGGHRHRLGQGQGQGMRPDHDLWRDRQDPR